MLASPVLPPTSTAVSHHSRRGIAIGAGEAGDDDATGDDFAAEHVRMSSDWKSMLVRPSCLCECFGSSPIEARAQRRIQADKAVQSTTCVCMAPRQSSNNQGRRQALRTTRGRRAGSVDCSCGSPLPPTRDESDNRVTNVPGYHATHEQEYAGQRMVRTGMGTNSIPCTLPMLSAPRDWLDIRQPRQPSLSADRPVFAIKLLPYACAILSR